MALPRRPLPRWLLWSQFLSLVAIAGLASALVPKVRRDRADEFPMIAKRVFVESPNDVLINFMDLRERLRTYVSTSPEKIGFYFEYLPTGVSINIGGNEEFFRASLIKLPMVMRAYKYAETGDLSLDEVLTVEEKHVDRAFGDFWKRGVGTRIAIRNIIPQILCNSDNTAFSVLYDRVNLQIRNDEIQGDRSVDDVYDFLDIPRQAQGVTHMVSPKNFSSILKSLYFSAYLTLEHSNEILETLAQPHPEPWIRAGVPKAVRVANKIGVYTLEPSYLFVHSDCGIVYCPGRPYLLCVMVHSGDTNASAGHIREISRMVYEYVEGAPH